MPNWCQNQLTLRHKDSREVERAIAAFQRGKLLNEFVPCPQELQDESTGFANADVKADRVAKYGYESWYDWSVQHWGTKWDVGGEDRGYAEFDEHTVVMDFDSAWAPPIAAMQALEQQGFEIKILYNEPGMAFCGWYVTGGINEEFNYTNLTAAETAEKLPDEIDDTFGIVEMLRDWEEATGDKDDTDRSVDSL